MQFLLTNVSLSGFSFSGLNATANSNLLPLYQVLICKTHGLLQLCQFWDTFSLELANKSPYKISIGSMQLRLQKLQKTDSETQELRTKDGYQNINRVLHYQGLRFMPNAICIKLINRHHNDSLADYFGIDNIRELLAKTYFWPTLWHNVEIYVKDCNWCLALKAIRHKPYNDLQSLPVLTHCWKDLLIDFVTGLPISFNWKRDSYNSFLVIVNWLTKMVHYKPVKITFNAPSLAKVIIYVIVWHYRLPNSIVTNRDLVFTSKPWSSLFYFFGIKQRLSIAFLPQTDGQTKRHNSIIEVYLRAFVNFEQNN